MKTSIEEVIVAAYGRNRAPIPPYQGRALRNQQQLFQRRLYGNKIAWTAKQSPPPYGDVRKYGDRTPLKLPKVTRPRVISMRFPTLDEVARHDVRVRWDVPTSPIMPDTEVYCREYDSSSDPRSAVGSYLAHGLPARQIVIAGDLRKMPMPVYAELARVGVFLKHIRYASLPEGERRARIEGELRLVYRGLLKAPAEAPLPVERPLDYVPGPARMTEDDLGTLIERLKRGEFGDPY
ncbi:MAG TPA: hypothetical protein VGQ36_03695 [Thermoanaerobaculia bacterium]|jgi:hypothetical protein|nr:hypothetical protein [Thermoanaerobaculia bacterium]